MGGQGSTDGSGRLAEGSRALIRANVSPIQLIGLLFFVLWRNEPRRHRLTTACRKSATTRMVVGSMHINDGTVNIQRETHFQTIRVGATGGTGICQHAMGELRVLRSLSRQTCACVVGRISWSVAT